MDAPESVESDSTGDRGQANLQENDSKWQVGDTYLQSLLDRGPARLTQAVKDFFSGHRGKG